MDNKLEWIGYIWKDYDTDGKLIGIYYFKRKPKFLFVKEVAQNIKPVYISRESKIKN